MLPRDFILGTGQTSIPNDLDPSATPGSQRSDASTHLLSAGPQAYRLSDRPRSCTNCLPERSAQRFAQIQQPPRYAARQCWVAPGSFQSTLPPVTPVCSNASPLDLTCNLVNEVPSARVCISPMQIIAYADSHPKGWPWRHTTTVCH